jgi:ribonuclease-3
MARKTGGESRSQKRDALPLSLADLERLLGHRFKRPELLTLALTHRSFVHESGVAHSEEAMLAMADPSQDNEQLEFLGDAALGLLAADALCRYFPSSREGELSRLRASIVSRTHLGQVGSRLGLGQWIRLGKGVEHGDGRNSASLLSDVVEALIAALFLDGGLAAARRFVEHEILEPALPALENSLTGEKRTSGAIGDHKTRLQEMLQASHQGAPQYRLISQTGPDHRRVFRVEVRLAENTEDGSPPLAEAEGSTKKQAQQEAARLAVDRLLELAVRSGAEHV